MITRTDTKGRKTTFLRQRKVDVSVDGMRTVTGHVIITEAIWHGMPDGYGHVEPDVSVSMEYRDPPEGLPLIDNSHPIGTPVEAITP